MVYLNTHVVQILVYIILNKSYNKATKLPDEEKGFIPDTIDEYVMETLDEQDKTMDLMPAEPRSHSAVTYENANLMLTDIGLIIFVAVVVVLHIAVLVFIIRKIQRRPREFTVIE